jgi:hypothetical protein
MGGRTPAIFKSMENLASADRPIMICERPENCNILQSKLGSAIKSLKKNLFLELTALLTLRNKVYKALKK